MAASVRSCPYPLLLIIPQTPQNETELGKKGLQWARRCSFWKGAQLPCFCLFPIPLEQLRTAKGPKTWARFPCTSLFLSGSSYHSLPVLSRYSFCLCSPIHMSWPGPSCPRTDCPVSPFYSPSVIGNSISTTRSSRSKSKAHQQYFKFLHGLKLCSL